MILPHKLASLRKLNKDYNKKAMFNFFFMQKDAYWLRWDFIRSLEKLL